jgi:hypothetical protein
MDPQITQIKGIAQIDEGTIGATAPDADSPQKVPQVTQMMGIAQIDTE